MIGERERELVFSPLFCTCVFSLVVSLIRIYPTDFIYGNRFHNTV
jgi:hypothetical protein